MRVLVAEDNEINRLLVCRLLTKRGHVTETANDGIEAVERATSGPFDLVLMDCEMPRMDGYEATRRIHASVPALRIVAMSAHGAESGRAKCLEAGMSDYLEKPLDQKRLASVLADCGCET